MTSAFRNLIMLPASYYVPKRNPLKPAGEDSHFINAAAQVIGVADGVGGWALKGIDAGEYSRTLMKNAAESVHLGSLDPKQILLEAFLKTLVKGSSTACIVSLDGDILRAANLGDSGFLVIRGNKVIYKSPAQQHRFNHPYQIGMGVGDRPWVAEEMEMVVEGGDVVVVGTDGLFDNVFDEDIEEVVQRCLVEGKSPSVLAWMLADMAVSNSLEIEMTCPFEVAAYEAGVEHFGGKYDDVTVVAAYVLGV